MTIKFLMLLGSNTQTQWNKKTEKREIWNNEIARYPKKIALKLSYIVIKL